MEPYTTGGIIIAAGKTLNEEEYHPLLQLGDITVVKRIVLTFQQAGIYPIVVITGRQASELEHHLSNYNVIFLQNEAYKDSRMLESAQIGLCFLQDKCERIVIAKVNTPLFTPQTVRDMLIHTEDIITPAFRKITGHPLVLTQTAAKEILSYHGPDGIRGCLKQSRLSWYQMDTDDEGVIYQADELKEDRYLLENHNKQILHPFIKLSIEKETLFFDTRTKLLLMLIKETHSVRSSCSQMALSCSKAWNIINHLEKELGYPVVERRHGGSSGGKTELTAQGDTFLKRYIEFEQNVREYSNREFKRLFLS